MENLFPTGPENNGLTKNEKIVSKLLALAIYAGIGLGLYVAFPFIITFLTNATAAGWLILKLLVVVGIPVAAGRTVWKNKSEVIRWYHIFIKGAINSFIKTRPIEYMRAQCDDAEIEAGELDNTIDELRANRETTAIDMKKNENEANDFFSKAKVADRMAKDQKSKLTDEEREEYLNQANDMAEMAQKRQNANVMFLPKLQAMDSSLDFLTKLHKSWIRDIKMMRDDIDFRERTLKTLTVINNSFKKASRLINGNPDERTKYEMAMKAYGDRVGMLVGNMKKFNIKAKDWVYNKSIQDSINKEKSQQLLSAYTAEEFKNLTSFENLKAGMDKQLASGNIAASSEAFQKTLDNPDSFSDLNIK